MTLALGVKAPLNFAVFSGVGGALLLANCETQYARRPVMTTFPP